MTATVRKYLLYVCALLLWGNAAVADGVGATAPRPAANPFNEPMALILADEFNGDTLDQSLWRSIDYGEMGIKNDTLRGPDNLEVKDGQLWLHVRKEQREHNGETAHWSAGYVYTRQPVPNNVYIEAHLKNGKASGVNNAFWMACVGVPRHSYRNRYEIDIVETRKDIRHGDNTGMAHLAWHDWKTYGYIVNDEGQHNHIAQGIHFEHTWDEYHTWGLWHGENEFIYYLDGQEVWRGKTHEKYADQWRTGVGKFDRWYTEEEKRAYGNFGQADWSYNGGYNGDRMNIVFSNLPWGSAWSPLTDEADGDVMAVDYLRIYKPKRLLTTTPLQHVALGLNSNELELPDDTQVHITLDRPMSIQAEHPWYFSVIAKKDPGAELRIDFEHEPGTPVFCVGVDGDNHLHAGFQNLASTATAYPAVEREEPFFEDGEDYLLVGRVTPGHDGERSAISLCAFKLPLTDTTEPYYYRNIDRHGNTSAGQGWHINQKDDASGEARYIRLGQQGEGNVVLSDFKIGVSFLSVLPGDATR